MHTSKGCCGQDSETCGAVLQGLRYSQTLITAEAPYKCIITGGGAMQVQVLAMHACVMGLDEHIRSLADSQTLIAVVAE